MVSGGRNGGNRSSLHGAQRFPNSYPGKIPLNSPELNRPMARYYPAAAWRLSLSPANLVLLIWVCRVTGDSDSCLTCRRLQSGFMNANQLKVQMILEIEYRRRTAAHENE